MKYSVFSFYRYVEDLLLPDVLSMQQFCQHGTTSTLIHSLAVAWITYRICLFLKRDPRESVRAALLHDFYLYDWHTPPVSGSEDGHKRLHGFTHPGIACRNASLRFDLTCREKDTIRKHMWPLTVIPPRYLDGYLVSLADKYCSLQETFHRNQASAAFAEQFLAEYTDFKPSVPALSAVQSH